MTPDKISNIVEYVPLVTTHRPLAKAFLSIQVTSFTFLNSLSEKPDDDTPRPEYPRPQFVRKDWLCLNGRWQFEIDQGDSGLERGLLERPLTDEIMVPFCPESKLSGLENHDFLEAVWYRREVEIPSEWRGRRVLLHFQAVDYDATVWVNGEEVGEAQRGVQPVYVRSGRRGAAGRAGDDRGAGTGQPPGSAAAGEASADVWVAGPPFTCARPGFGRACGWSLCRRFIWAGAMMTPDVANGVIRLEQPVVLSNDGSWKS